MKEIYKGNIVYAEDYDELKVFKDSFLIVEDGIIEDVCEKLPAGYEKIRITDYGNRLIIPAFADLHIHASQYVQRGIGMDCLLFDWLNTYTFPQEARFADREYAYKIYAKLIRDLISNGSFHLSLFTTIHYEACDILFRMLQKSGLFAYVGITNMDRNSPAYYIDTTEESLAKTERFIIEHQGDDRVRPILTPRFAPTCSKRLLQGLGEMAKKYQVGIQTHLVESKAEAKWAAELFPEYGSDGKIYEECGLLQGNGPKIFAHVIFPTQIEEDILKRYAAISVHCPDATSNITAGIMPLAAMHDRGLKIALGSDIGGGHFIGINHQISRAVQISKMKEFYEEGNRRIALKNAFYLATAAGGSVFEQVGKLKKGYRFNALVIDDLRDEGYESGIEEMLERFCYIGDESKIFARYLDGKLIDPDEVYQDLLESFNA